MRGLRSFLVRVLPRRFGKASPLSIAEDLRHKSFDQVLKRRLLQSVHDVTGPDSAPCISGATLVAAGLEYLTDVADSTESICPVIGAYTIALNEIMADDQRQRLLPYATRLAGTADEFVVKIRRAEHLTLAAARIFAARALRWSDYRELAIAWEVVQDLDAVLALRNPTVQIIGARQIHLDGQSPEVSAVLGAYSAADIARVSPVRTIKGVRRAILAAFGAARAVGDPEAENEVWEAAFATLDSMLSIGRSAKPIEASIARERMERARWPGVIS